MSRDLKAQLPDATCFSETNLLYMKNFYLLFPMAEFTPQLVEQTESIDDDLITQQLVEQLGVDIFSILYEREGKALTNFKNTLPATSSDLAQEITRDPYCFAFTGVTGMYYERALKDASVL